MRYGRKLLVWAPYSFWIKLKPLPYWIWRSWRGRHEKLGACTYGIRAEGWRRKWGREWDKSGCERDRLKVEEKWVLGLGKKPLALVDVKTED